MKTVQLYFTAILGLLLFSSCELDNYNGPDSTFYGSIIDSQTNEPVGQDIIQGSVIQYTELGYENPQNQFLRFKVDGTFRNNLMFAGTYAVAPKRGNFVPIPNDTIEIKGDTEYDFFVQPYIRVKDVNIQKNGTKVVATFKIERTVADNVSQIALFAHANPSVGFGVRTVTTVQDINAATDPNTIYTLEIDLPSNSSNLEPGEQYFFRVGALIDVPEAKFNYAEAVRIEL